MIIEDAEDSRTITVIAGAVCQSTPVIFDATRMCNTNAHFCAVNVQLCFAMVKNVRTERRSLMHCSTRPFTDFVRDRKYILPLGHQQRNTFIALIHQQYSSA